MNKFKFIFIVICITTLFLLSSCSMGYSSENPKQLKYKLADACIESFGGGRFQIMEGFDESGYSLWDMKTDMPLFIGKGEKFKKIGTKVYFKHWNGYTILDYKNISLKEYTNVSQLSKAEDIEYFNEIVTRNKEIFGTKYILLEKYDDFSSEEKEIFKKMEEEKK